MALDSDSTTGRVGVFAPDQPEARIYGMDALWAIDEPSNHAVTTWAGLFRDIHASGARHAACRA